MPPLPAGETEAQRSCASCQVHARIPTQGVWPECPLPGASCSASWESTKRCTSGEGQVVSAGRRRLAAPWARVLVRSGPQSGLCTDHAACRRLHPARRFRGSST